MARVAATLVVVSGLLAFVAINLVWHAAERHYLAGRSRQAAGAPGRAYHHFIRAGEINPLRSEYHRSAGELSYEAYEKGSGDPATLYRAMESYQAAVIADPAYPYNHYNLGRALLALREAGARGLPSPEPYLKTALETDPENHLFLAGWIRWNLVQGKKDTAIHAFSKLFKQDPGAVHEYGEALLNTNDDIKSISGAIGSRPDLNVELALFLLNSGRLALALAQIDRVPEKARTRPRIAAKISGVLAENGEFDEAERMLRASLAKNPGDLTATTSLAKVLAKQGDHQAAIEAYKGALKSNPGWRADIHIRIGWLAQRNGMDSVALEHLEKALEIGPVPPYKLLDLHKRLAALHEGRGNRSAALHHYEKAHELDPADKKTAYKVEILRIRVDMKKREQTP